MGATWQGVILGEPAAKANQRRLVTVGRGRFARRRVIKSAKALGYVEAARIQLAGQRAEPLLTGKLRLTATLYYRTERPDLDESLVLDVLQGFVYANDRQIRSKRIDHAIDRASPRAELLVEALP